MQLAADQLCCTLANCFFKNNRAITASQSEVQSIQSTPTQVLAREAAGGGGGGEGGGGF